MTSRVGPIFLLALSFAACDQSSAGGAGPSRRAWEGPLDADRQAAAYARMCASCHGSVGRGDGPKSARLSTAPPDFTSAKWQSSRSDAQLTTSIHEGRGPMPAFKWRCDDLAIADMVRYTRDLGR